MILIIEVKKVYEMVTGNNADTTKVNLYDKDVVKNMQEYLKDTDKAILSDIAAKKFNTWTELSDAMKETKTLPGSFCIKEIKEK